MRPTLTERVGHTLCRPAHQRSVFVADLLAHVRARGFDGAPLALGFDARGRQMFSWIEGDVPDEAPFHLPVRAQEEAARLIRGFHDAAASSPGLDAETIEHGDLGPHNTVFRDGRPVAIIDWDEDVRPGRRAADFAQAVWGFADLLEEAVPVEAQAAGLSAMCTAYGGITPDRVLGELAARFERARGEHAALGRAGAVAVFEDLIARLTSSRTELLARPRRP